MDLELARSVHAKQVCFERGPAPDLLDGPDPVRWYIAHDACDQHMFAYHFRMHDIDSWRELVDTIAHLMGKRWLPATDFQSVLYDLLEGKGNPGV